MKVALVVLSALLIYGLGSSLVAHFWAGNDSERGSIITAVKQTLPFVTPVFAQSLDPSTTFLDEEAGISLYTDLNQTLDLSTAKTMYKTIETETSEYIVGSVSLPNLPENDDVHCFVYKEGWIVVYYLKEEPVSKIIDWNYYSAGRLTNTKLQLGLDKMCSGLGVTATDINHYHFQYPYANKWMIIIDSQQGEGTDSFNLIILREFTVYERSWSHHGELGTVEITEYGLLTVSQLSPSESHTIEAMVSKYHIYLRIDGETINEISISSYGNYYGNSYVGIALVYREP